MEKNIWIISQTNSHILTQIITDNFMMLGLMEHLKIVDNVDDSFVLDLTLKEVTKVNNPVVYFIFEDKKLSDTARNFCDSNKINYVDIHRLAFSFFYKLIASKVNGEYNDSYLKEANISFIEFAIASDDGKKLDSLKDADIVIVGISRTTKTPLSMYLSNHGYKVANVPLVPEVDLPVELLSVPKKNIFALVMDAERLVDIRKRRLKSLGLPDDAIYASMDRIKQEMDYANEVFQKLDCKAIDVSSLSIEETAGVIINTKNQE